MRSDVLATDLAAERSRAIRLLLRSPMLNSEDQPDGFRDVVRHHDWLVAWFDDTCGWQLTIDPGAGFARLAKRSRGAKVDVSRPLRRSRGGHQAFDRRRSSAAQKAKQWNGSREDESRRQPGKS